jgi:hypothetical protein
MAMNHLERLKRLMPPIDPPPESDVNWPMAEEIFGTRFPTDFKNLIATYGNVIWCDLFRFIYPETSDEPACRRSREDVIETLSYLCGGENRLWDESGQEIHIPPYPESGGLLPCLTDTNTGFVCWHMVGNPD